MEILYANYYCLKNRYLIISEFFYSGNTREANDIQPLLKRHILYRFSNKTTILKIY